MQYVVGQDNFDFSSALVASPHKKLSYIEKCFRLFTVWQRIITAITSNMAPEQKKRSRPIPNASQRSKKRQKIETTKGSQAVQKRPVAVDALPWNEVEMPEMFDDAEGFFGLEEVEGVEVVREGNAVKFVSSHGLEMLAATDYL